MAPPDGDMPGELPADGAAGLALPGAQTVEITPDDAEVARLAALPPLAYARERAAAAERLGIKKQLSILDKLVATERDKAAGGKPSADTAGQGRPLKIADPEPWPEPVDGAALLDEMAATIRSYVILSSHQADAVALWVAFTHAFDAFGPRGASGDRERRAARRR